MSSDFVWHAVEIAEEDACPDCGGHPELCGCDGADPLEATSEPAPLAEIDSEAKQPVSMPDEETKRDRPKRACHYCGTLTRKRRRDASGNERTVDHIIPRTLGGPNEPWNRVVACRDCKKTKGNSWPTCECSVCANARRMFLKRQAQDRTIRERVEVKAFYDRLRDRQA